MTAIRSAALALAVAASGAAPASAVGAEPSRAYSVVVRGSAVSLQDEMDRDVDVGPGIEVAVRRAFEPFLEGEIAVGYSRNGTTRDVTRPYPDVTGDVYVPMHQQLDVVPVTVAVRASLPARALEPWLLAGAGLFFAKLEDHPTDPAPRREQSDRAAPFGTFLGVGANLTISPRLFATFDARYRWVKSVSFFTEGGYGLASSGDRWSLDGVVASVGVGARF